MTSRRFVGFWLVLGFGVSAAGAVAGCSAGGVLPEGTGGDSSEGGGTATGTSEVGGSGGEGGSAAGEPLPCGIDCSGINTDQCQEAICDEQAGNCVVVAREDGTTCDDGQFCTINDTCQNGSCMGGGQNDCGNTPPACNEVTCDEQTESCSVAPANNGDPCQGTDLCVVGSTCNNGTCVGGEPNLCFFQPVPDECHVSVCNPSSGVCEPQPGNDGDGCTVMSDLCSVGNTCLGGICSGGSPKDCSQLTVGCFDGVCDTTTGQCAQNPIMPGNQCAEATDQCNVGICDMNGSCNPMPANENMACDTDGCFVGQTCSSGNCQGGTQITACINGDNCCPSGCDLTNDDDCGCDYALISDETQLDDPAITALITANGHYFTTLNNNGSTGVHTSNMALLNQYETIILHNHDRVLTTTEATNLSNWIQAGGSLLVTGYDSLGSPTDTVLANLVNCTGPADGPFSSSLLVVNNTHPIMLGPAQAFTLNQALIAGSTDHDTCNPGPGSTQLLTVSGSSSKLLVTDNVGQGMVIYWNGNGGASGPLHDWAGTGGSSQPALQNLFVNVIEHMCQ